MTQFMLINLLERDVGWTLRTLATALNLVPTTLLQTVDSLEQRGVVARQRATVDRRQVHITLTEVGRAIQQASQQQFHIRLTAIFQAMQPDERRALVLRLEAFANAATAPQKEP